MRRSPVLASSTSLLWLFALALFHGCDSQGTFTPYAQAMNADRTIEIGGTPLVVETAITNQQREEGLKHRMTLPVDAGMLFVYPDAGLRRLWTKDCYLPLSVAFLDADAKVLNLEDMEPFEEAPGAVSQGKSKYVLWANAGWFGQHGLEPGDTVELPGWVEDLAVE